MTGLEPEGDTRLTTLTNREIAFVSQAQPIKLPDNLEALHIDIDEQKTLWNFKQ